MKTYKDFVRASSNYLTPAVASDGLGIHNALTLGCWVWFDAESTNNSTGIIGKWNFTANEAAYLVYKDSSNNLKFTISTDGSTTVYVSDMGTMYTTSQWFYVVGRFTPSVEVALFVNGMWYKNQTGIPATIFHSSQEFEIGRYNEDNYLDGRVSQAFICAYSVPDRFICAMYSHAKALYMSKNIYQSNCSSSSSTSTTSSSSSTVIP